MAERRQLSDAEKADILKRHGMRCFIDGHPIESEDDIEFDHIVPVAAGGTTTLENLAPVCRRHNRQKGTMVLSEYRDYLKLGSFFGDGSPKYLDDIILAKGHKLGQLLQYEVNSGKESVSLYFDAGKETFSLYTCPVTGWQYFYALIPVQYLKNDRDLQPRPLRQQSMWGLYRHFQRNTQLAPSICRLDEDGTFLLFDGQHKAAAQIWAGRKAVECKVYIQPVAKLIKETNLEAHQSYRQMSFYSYELMRKYADICGEDWNEYAALEGRKSESGFVEFLVNVKKMSVTKAKSEVARAIHWRILNDPANKLGDFISEKTRARRQPLTYYRIEKTIFRHLLSPIPNAAEFQSDGDLRGTEERNLIRLMSIIAEEGLRDRWNPERADALHQRTERIFSAGAIRAWVRILRDVLNAYLQLYLKGPEEVQRVLYRELTDEQFHWITKFVRQVFAHPVWDAPDTSDRDISKSLTKDDDITAMSLLRERGLVVEWVLQSAAHA
ncbi:MAG: HNH endonuclease [Deltaproteobacteria bacterium]|nr:HNH endonuclease [Deltaproteobacteria bacterium]